MPELEGNEDDGYSIDGKRVKGRDIARMKNIDRMPWDKAHEYLCGLGYGEFNTFEAIEYHDEIFHSQYEDDTVSGSLHHDAVEDLNRLDKLASERKAAEDKAKAEQEHKEVEHMQSVLAERAERDRKHDSERESDLVEDTDYQAFVREFNARYDTTGLSLVSFRRMELFDHWQDCLKIFGDEPFKGMESNERSEMSRTVFYDLLTKHRQIISIHSEKNHREWWYGIDLGKEEAIRRFKEDEGFAKITKRIAEQA